MGNCVKNLFLILCILGFSDRIFAQTGRPDLIITNIELKYIHPPRRHFPLPPGQPVSARDNMPYPMIFVTVENIGNADFADLIYLAYTNRWEDMIRGRYSHQSRLGLGPLEIKVNDSLLLACPLSVYGGKKFKFLLQIGKIQGSFISHGPSDGAIPIIEEARTDNNTYECEFPNYK